MKLKNILVVIVILAVTFITNRCHAQTSDKPILSFLAKDSTYKPISFFRAKGTMSYVVPVNFEDKVFVNGVDLIDRINQLEIIIEKQKCNCRKCKKQKIKNNPRPYKVYTKQKSQY